MAAWSRTSGATSGLARRASGGGRARGRGDRELLPKNLNRSVDEALAGFAPSPAAEDGIHVRANISTVFGDPFEGRPARGQVLHVVSRVVEAGIDDVALSDTIGVANARRVFDIFEAVREAHPRVTFGAHFHDTRGLASANTVAAQAGIGLRCLCGRARRQPQHLQGRGGGLLTTEDLVYMLTEMGIETGVALESLMDAADLLERLVGHPLNTDRALVASRFWRPVRR